MKSALGIGFVSGPSLIQTRFNAHRFMGIKTCLIPLFNCHAGTIFQQVDVPPHLQNLSLILHKKKQETFCVCRI